VNPITRRIAFYGGTFDPVHCGHLAVSKAVSELFGIDEFFFLPAFHAPHKADSKPTSALHRYAMLCLATSAYPKIAVSTIELDHGKSRFSYDTLTELQRLFTKDRIFFVMGADSWADILTWHRWEEVLLMTDIIVISRPGYEINFGHVSDPVRERIIDLRGGISAPTSETGPSIFITDSVNMAISGTAIRSDILEDDVLDRTDQVPPEVAKYIEKYELYR
jgi:nicotinate-nucleotide adenylyltransferase